jgi:uncharacterized protein YbcV (DUF1398 family)
MTTIRYNEKMNNRMRYSNKNLKMLTNGLIVTSRAQVVLSFLENITLIHSLTFTKNKKFIRLYISRSLYSRSNHDDFCPETQNEEKTSKT